MKKLLFIPAFLIFVSCGSNEKIDDKTPSTDNNSIAQADITEAPTPNAQCELIVEGMTCEIGCVRTIKSHLSKMDGITFNVIDFNPERTEDFVTVQFDSNQVSLADVTDEIEGIAQGIYDVTESKVVQYDQSLTTE